MRAYRTDNARDPLPTKTALAYAIRDPLMAGRSTLALVGRTSTVAQIMPATFSRPCISSRTRFAFPPMPAIFHSRQQAQRHQLFSNPQQPPSPMHFRTTRTREQLPSRPVEGAGVRAFQTDNARDPLPPKTVPPQALRQPAHICGKIKVRRSPVTKRTWHHPPTYPPASSLAAKFPKRTLRLQKKAR